MPCLTDQQANDYTRGRLADDDRDALARHLAECAACRERVGDTPSMATAHPSLDSVLLDEERRIHDAIGKSLPPELANSSRSCPSPTHQRGSEEALASASGIH